MSFLDSAFNAFSDAVDSVLPAISDVSSASDLADVAGVATGGIPWGSIIAGGATLLGSQSNNNTARSLAAQQQAFSASQASTIYQRGAADLAAAGINPILAYGSPASMGSYTQPNIQPSLSLAANAAVNAYEVGANVVSKQAQSNLHNAQSVTESHRPHLIDAETNATSARDANTRMDTLLKHEQIQKTKFESDLVKGNISLQSLQAEVLRSQAYLNSENAKSQLSVRALNNARSDLVDVERMLRDPELRSKLEHPDLHSAAETSKAASEIAEPFLNLVKAVRPGMVVNKTYNIRK